ncbi:glycerol acyltransferase [Pedobacter yulinensis]|uniref:Glycerol acyltransferase n=1 Tax=Pedobacter yulinensis TaxID=2126353 RepID=A0A2T3HQ87_9SPHI|nr:lysophospholipid acyltransferase family protein [Pedobacter yulinensis]PST84589.1 glycerol acyltransferase [Pedobacter yulinensis]
MFEPRQNKLVSGFFSWYISFLIKRNFTSYTYSDLDTGGSESVLLLANHFSWWDGFLLFHLNKKTFRRNFHVLITADNYKTVFFLKYLGGFAVSRPGRDIVETLSYAGKLLEQPGNLVLLFPQGKIYSSQVGSIQFEKGVMQILQAGERRFRVVFAATFTDYWDRKKAAVKTYLQEWVPEPYVSLQLLKNAYNKHYQQSAEEQSRKVV